MTDHHVLVASNRGPATFFEQDGELVAKRGAGGLVSALTSAVQETGGLWIASAMSEADRRKAAEDPHGRMEVKVEDALYRLRLLSFDDDVYDRFYNSVSNRLLWFLHHYLWDLPRAPVLGEGSRRAWDAYRSVNVSFAGALAEDAGDEESAVLLQVFHL